MASTIVTKNSSTASAVPVTGDLTQGELAVNVTDKKLYTKDSGGTVVKLVGGLGNQEANAVAITGGSINGTTVGATTASTGAFTTLSASSTTTLSGGTANGVAYLNGSKVVTTGSALTFDGTNTRLGVGVASPGYTIDSGGIINTASAVYWGGGVGKLQYSGTDAYIDSTGSTVFRISGSTEQMRLTSTGLGIGTSSPAAKLHVVSGAVEPLRLGSTTSGYNYITHLNVSSGVVGYLGDGLSAVTGYAATDYAIRANQGNLLFATNGNNVRAIIDTSGNLGLGVTPSAWGSATKAMQFTTGGSVYGYSTAQVGIAANAYLNSSLAWTYRASNYATLYRQDDGVHSWNTAASGTAGNAITFTQAMTLDASGNLLIGQTGTASALLTLADSSSGKGIGWGTTSANYANIWAAYSSGDLVLGGNVYGSSSADSYLSSYGGATPRAAMRISGFGGYISFATAGSTTTARGSAVTLTEVARIDSSGNLLFGVTSSFAGQSPTAQFYRAGGAVLWLKRGTDYGEVAYFKNYGDTTVGNISVAASSTAYNTSSDYRLKEDIQPMTGALAKVAALKPVTYKWKSDGSDGEGFIAHELAEVVPQCVTGEKDAVDAEGKPVYQGIDTSFLVATLTAAIQELKAEFDAYKATHP